jgi:hypothetical protein
MKTEICGIVAPVAGEGIGNALFEREAEMRPRVHVGYGGGNVAARGLLRGHGGSSGKWATLRARPNTAAQEGGRSARHRCGRFRRRWRVRRQPNRGSASSSPFASGTRSGSLGVRALR